MYLASSARCSICHLRQFSEPAFERPTASTLQRFTSPKYAGLLDTVELRRRVYASARPVMPWELPALLDGEMVREGWRELQTIAGLDQTVEGIPTRAYASLLSRRRVYMRNQLLRDTDWASLAHSLEVRVPFVDWCVGSGSCRFFTERIRQTSARWHLLLAVSLFPPEVLQRAKTGFAIPTMDVVAGETSGRTRSVASEDGRNAYTRQRNEVAGAPDGRVRRARRNAKFNRDMLAALCVLSRNHGSRRHPACRC